MKTIVKKTLLVIAILGLSSSITYAQSKKTKRSKAKVVSTHKKTTRVIKSNKVVTNQRQNRYVHKTARVNSVPNGSNHIFYNKVRYTHHNGVFYKRSGNSFVTIIPPVGLRVAVLPIGFNRVAVGPRNYYYCSGTYYRNFNGGYEVVQDPYFNTYVIN